MIEDHAHVVHVFGRGIRPQKPHHVLLADLGFKGLSDQHHPKAVKMKSWLNKAWKPRLYLELPPGA